MLLPVGGLGVGENAMIGELKRLARDLSDRQKVVVTGGEDIAVVMTVCRTFGQDVGRHSLVIGAALS